MFNKYVKLLTCLIKNIMLNIIEHKIFEFLRIKNINVV